jgi:hypothetical protein
MKEVTVFGQQNPIRGMKSDLGAEFIGPDFAQLVENLRLRNGYAQARNGYGSALIADINASASYRGHFTCTIGTTAYLFVAVRFSSLTRVYATNTPFALWVEITDASTRFSTDGNIGFAAISVNRTVTSTDKPCIIFGNGVDNNRIADYSVSPFGPGIAVINDPSYPTISYQAPVPKYVHYFAAGSGKVEAITDSGKFNIANTSGIVNNFSTTGAAFTLSTTSTGAQTVTLLFDKQKQFNITIPNVSTAPGLGGLVIQKEVGMLWTNRRSGTSSSLFTGGLNNTGVNVVDYLNKIEVLALADGALPTTITAMANNGAGLIRVTSAGHGYSSGDFIQLSTTLGTVEANGTWKITVIDANNYDLNLSTFTNAYTSGGSARKLAYYTLWSGAEDGPPLEKTVRRGDTNSEDGIIYYYPSGTLEGLTYFCGYRFTGAVPPSTITNNLLGSFSAGSVDSQSLYAVSFGQTTSFAEGYAVPCEKRTKNFNSGPLGFQGLLYSFDPPNGVHTAYWVYSDGISSTGVRNLLNYYRADPETTNDGTTFLGQFYYNGAQSLLASLISGTLNIYSDDTLPASLRTSRVAYDETHIQPPAGNVMTYVNDRLYISGVSTGTSTESQLWVSADRDPLDFARVVRSDDFGNLVSRSPTFRTFAGERVTGMSVLNTDILGVDTLLLWTDRRLYRLGGFSAIELSRASILGDKGCLFPNTITTYNNSAFFLDNEGQVRVTNGASISDPISYRNVASELANGTVAQATAFAGFQRYEIFYRSANTGTGNDKGLLYDSDLGAWVRDGYAIDIRGAVAVDASPRRRMFVITEKGSLYEWDKDGVTTDAGSNIATTLTTRILATNWDRISFGRAGVVCDDVNSGTMATTRSFRGQNLPTGANSPGAVGSLSLDSTTTTAWKNDTLSGGTGVPGATGYGGFVSYTATVPGGWKWYEANIQVQGTGVKGSTV